MANYVFKVNVKAELAEAEADGGPCCLCGDSVWLRAFRLVLFAGPQRIGHSTGIICSSCGEMLKEGSDA